MKAVAWLVVLGAVIAITILFYRYEKEKERLAQEPYFTEYKLNTTEMAALNGEYHVKVTPGVTKLSKEDNIDTHGLYICEDRSNGEYGSSRNGDELFVV